MVHLIKGFRRLAAAAALIGGAALLSLSATPASAEIPTCQQAEFCLYVNADANGGIYRNDGSDRNLNNDRYEVHNVDITVGNTARNAFNNAKPAARDDVIVYAETNRHGANDCIRREIKRRLVGAEKSVRPLRQAGADEPAISRATSLTRGELVARLLFEHYAPRVGDDSPASADGGGSSNSS